MAGGRHTGSVARYPRHRDRAQRSRNLWLLLGCAVVLCGLVFLFTARGIRVLDLRQQHQFSLSGYDEAMAARQDLERQLALKDDLAAIEEAARARLGWVMPGEVRVIFINRAEESENGGE